MTQNCGLCGRPIFKKGVVQPICDGCIKSRNKAGKRVQRRFDRMHELEEKWEGDTIREEESEDAQDAWVD